MAFLRVNNFFCVFKNTDQKNICIVHLLILKLNQSQNTKNKFFWGGFSSKTKNALFRGSKMVLFKSTNFEFVLLHLFFNVKGSSTPIFTKNINIWAPWKCFENENFDARVLSDQKKFPHSTLLLMLI